MLKALKRWAKQNEKGTNDIQIGLSINPDNPDDVLYTKIIKGLINVKVTFKQVIDSENDMLGKEEMARPFIQSSILKFAEEYNEKPESIFVVIYCLNVNATLKSDVRLHLYAKGSPIRPVLFEEIFQNGE